LRSHQRISRSRQNPESPRTMIDTPGQAWRSRCTSRLISALAFLAPSMRLRRR
jgi:hypothetical protein